MSLKQYIPAIKYGNLLGIDELEGAGVATFGTVFWVDATNGDDDNDGLTKDKAFKTVAAAYAATTSGAHDVIFLSANAAHAVTEMLDVSKSRVHFVGLGLRGGAIGLGARARITMGVTTAATDLAVMQNTGVGNTFHGIKFDSSNTVDESLYSVVEAGEYAVYEGCEFYKSSDLNVTGAAEVANNGDSAQWINCYFGSTANIIADNVIRPCMITTGGIVSGKKCRDNYMENCLMARKAGGTEATFIYGANATDIERMFVIKGTTFFNNPLSAATPAVAVNFGAAQTEGAVFLDANCAVVDVTVMATTGQNIFVQAPSSPTYATSGLSVAS